MSQEQFDAELNDRIESLQSAADTYQLVFAPALQWGSSSSSILEEEARMWKKFEAAEHNLELAWKEHGRRRDVQLDKDPGR